MSNPTVSAQVIGEIPPLPVRKFTVEEYHQLINSGILKSGDPFELLEGWIVPKMGKNPPHVWSLERVAVLLACMLPTTWHVRRQDPITTLESEPEPDIAVVRGTAEDYRTRHPKPADTGLTVEISDSTLSRDRGAKARIYAGAGIPVYWIVNLADRQVEVYTDPSGTDATARYRQPQIYGLNEFVPVILDGQEIGTIAVREMLP